MAVASITIVARGGTSVRLEYNREVIATGALVSGFYDRVEQLQLGPPARLPKAAGMSDLGLGHRLGPLAPSADIDIVPFTDDNQIADRAPQRCQERIECEFSHR
jgi:hypothetical protein